jgi:class 3 adenylate cyclase
MLRRIGVRGRLLLAFFGISGFAVLSAVAAFFAFGEAAKVVDRLARERMPASIAAVELSRQAERIVSAAPMLLVDMTPVEQMRTDRKLRTEIAEFERLLTKVRQAQPDPALLSDIEGSVTRIRQNLAQVQLLVAAPFEGSLQTMTSYRPPSMIRQPVTRSLSVRRAEGQKLVQDNYEDSANLAAAVNRLIDHERTEIAKGEAEILATQHRSGIALIGVVALSIISSALIVWLYVGRSIVGRLMALSGSMLAIAGGNLEAPLPAGSGSDEIGRMADSLRVFRDTAIENERAGRLKRFLAPQVAELIVSSGDESVLDSHRRNVAVLFCDLRGFTAFAETAEPEEIMAVLRDYHASLGRLVHKFGGTLERFTGDGLIVLFNDPLPCSDPCLVAARLALEMRACVDGLAQGWQQLGSRLGFGIGLAYGYATLGRVGFEGRFDYTAIGSVVNLAARLCERAKAGEILVDSKVYAEIRSRMKADPLGEFTLKGFSRPIEIFNLIADEEERGLTREIRIEQPGMVP